MGSDQWELVLLVSGGVQLHGVESQRYFTNVLTRLANGWPQSRIDELMPWHWAPAKND
jgi:transposase